jgi:hypothetical protein
MFCSFVQSNQVLIEHWCGRTQGPPGLYMARCIIEPSRL